jgi:hypothetical protein
MITLRIIAEQVGEHMTTTYHAEMDATSTQAEKEHIDLATNAIQKMIADKGGTGEFIERKASNEADKSGFTRLGLWNFFVQTHDLHLLDSELNDIIVAVRSLKE